MNLAVIIIWSVVGVYSIAMLIYSKVKTNKAKRRLLEQFRKQDEIQENETNQSKKIDD